MIEANEVNSTFYALRLLSHGLDTSRIDVIDGDEYPASEFTREEQEQALKIIHRIEESESVRFGQLPPDKIDFYLTVLSDQIEEMASNDLADAGYPLEPPRAQLFRGEPVFPGGSVPIELTTSRPEALGKPQATHGLAFRRGKSDQLISGENVGSKKRRRYRRFWEKLCLDRHQQILGYASSLAAGDLCLAEDLVQEGYLRALKYSPNPIEIRNPLSYIKTVIRNVWIDSRQPATVSLDDLIQSQADNPVLVEVKDVHELLESKEFVETLRNLSESPSPEFDPMLKMLAEGRTWQEIATAFDESVSTTKYRWYSLIRRVTYYRSRQR